VVFNAGIVGRKAEHSGTYPRELHSLAHPRVLKAAVGIYHVTHALVWESLLQLMRKQHLPTASPTLLSIGS
jgi:hypothetical protein